VTTSPNSGSEAKSAFDRLHPKVQQWIWHHGWDELRPAQVQSVPPILDGRTDVILSAATATGKTEAAFLPICSALAFERATEPGIEVLYLSPLKALINDQFDRLQELFEQIDVPVHRWHGDVSGAHKRQVLRNPSGLVLMTPESLEALFVRRGTQVRPTFGALRYVVIDELHAFFGTERGAQLQSLLNRLELAVRRRIPRIALSATLGDMSAAGEFLRPGGGARVRDIIAEDDKHTLLLQLRGYMNSEPESERTGPDADEREALTQRAIAQDLFRVLRGSDNLVFANSRELVEIYSDRLTQLSEEARLPNQFFAHHGSLSKDLREHVEARLKDRSMPTTAVCTSTLELGIDIGDVESIAQVGAPPSVASLRQRVGRSGRRGEPAKLWMYAAEDEITPKTQPTDALRANMVQSIAMVDLLLTKWYEPPAMSDLHLSTLIQQVLSIIAQQGGGKAAELFSVTCKDGPFHATEAQFAQLLRQLGSDQLLVQAPDNTLLLGTVGERIVNHFSFYAAFTTPDEWRLMSEGRQLGTMPINSPLAPGLLLIFAGRRWTIVGVDTDHKVVDLVPAPGGKAPHFHSSPIPVNDRVRKEMLSIYRSGSVPSYLDQQAAELLAEGRQNFVRYQLDRQRLLEAGSSTYVFLWAGDRIANTVVALLTALGFAAVKDGLAISVAKITPVELVAQFTAVLAGPIPDPIELASMVHNKAVEKFDVFLPEELLDAGYAGRSLDVPGAWRGLGEVLSAEIPS
jgi:ATP-dependent Lhr-like helicase